MSRFVNRSTLNLALTRLLGTGGPLLKIWFTLKHMGLAIGAPPVKVTTGNSTPSLKRLFSCGASDGTFYIPFAHTKRYLVMKHDAARSIIQTNINRWATSGSVVTCDPTAYLDFSSGEGEELSVSPGRRYPLGLGRGTAGFALGEDVSVAIPITAFAVWYGRQTAIPDGENPTTFLVNDMIKELRISQTERAAIFSEDELEVETQVRALSDKQVFEACKPFMEGEQTPTAELMTEDLRTYERRITTTMSGLDLPLWLRTSPEDVVKELLSSGAKAILLFGPPRTGKTRILDAIEPKSSANRATIQIHDGWGYDHLVEGFKPDPNGRWSWQDGPLKRAIQSEKRFIVLEEINRTAISQALGEVFSLIEEAYRGTENGILLRSGQAFSIPPDTVFMMTMNTLDKSTEDVDDALLGRVAAVEFPPRPEELQTMLLGNGVPEEVRGKIAQLFAEILKVYPLGQGYFADLRGNVNGTQATRYYMTRVRPVLVNHFGELRKQELSAIDNFVDDLFK